MNIAMFFSRAVRAAALLAAALAFAAPSHAAAPVDKDHPLVGRYEGSKLIFYRAPKFDEFSLLKGQFPWREYENVDMLQLEGNVSFYYYDFPKDRTTLEVQRNYETSLKAKGMDILFSCNAANSSCYTEKSEANPIWFAAALGKTRWPDGTDPNGGWILGAGGMRYACEEGNTRYLLAKREASEGTTHVGIAFCDRGGTHRVFVAVIESKAMDTDKIAFVDASAMQKSLDATGRVSLYGIYFDTDKDTLKPESKPTLDEIGKLMKANPQLRLQVVGHTDSTGGDAHNKDLSNRRAAAVMRALTQAGIAPDRFTSRGAGASEPVAPNDNEAGRAKNRRVELVKL